MLERERHRLILKFVEERAVASVADLVELLGASEATVRRDINALALRHEVRRVRGGAEALRPRPQTQLAGAPFALRRGKAPSEKRVIARMAASLVEPGSSVILNNGTTTLQMVDFLQDKDLDILTNSFPIAAGLMSQGRHRVTLPGGRVFREQGIILSPFENDVVSNFWAGQLFTGCYGLNPFGLIEADPLIAQSEVKLFERAERIIVLADSSKLGQRASMIVAPLAKIDLLITDEGATEEDLTRLRKAGLEVVIANTKSERDASLVA
ncbi:DeoR/GlpR family DNA-binding transcription regulator [Arboricoccus pini]|nr:DeoR/GlpR family DNA-binding transcription regulator [Arboricoccus pini]